MDILAELRGKAKNPSRNLMFSDGSEATIHSSPPRNVLLDRAADEIERLQTALVDKSKRMTEIGNKYAIQAGEVERLRAALKEAEYFFRDDFPDGVDGPCAVTTRYREAYRAICAALT